MNHSPVVVGSDALSSGTDDSAMAQNLASPESEQATPLSPEVAVSSQDFAAPSLVLDQSSERKGTLYVVSSPIGNPEDITLRALRVLKMSDVIVGEEGKTVARLLHEHKISKNLEELNEHNEATQTGVLLEMLKEGKSLALVSDAGTPLLADPGNQLVRKCIERNIRVKAVPGATSIMTALITSGLPMNSFLFAGFVSREPAERLQELKKLADEPRTVVLLETPYRLVPLLEAARQLMPTRRAYLGCNLTMDSETHHYGTVSELYTKFVVMRFKGEFVFCFEGAKGVSQSGTQSRFESRDARPSRFGSERTFAGDRKFGGERKPYGDKPYGERKSYGDRPSGDRKPYGDRSAGGGERKSYGDKPYGERKSYGDRPSGDRKPYGDRSSGGGERKSYGDRPSGDRKPYGDRSSGGGERKSYGDRPSGGDRRPSSGGGERKFGGKPSGGGERKFGGRPSGGGGERKFGGKPSGGGERKFTRNFDDRNSRGAGDKPREDKPRNDSNE
jgi:16S rRNA (cytidine1402-2'-O)-methyltransferase